jgi:hypothetical protein
MRSSCLLIEMTSSEGTNPWRGLEHAHHYLMDGRTFEKTRKARLRQLVRITVRRLRGVNNPKGAKTLCASRVTRAVSRVHDFLIQRKLAHLVPD